VLAPDPTVALARDRDRAEKTVAEQWIWLADVIRDELDGYGVWIDSGEQTPEQSVAFIRNAGSKAMIHAAAIDTIRRKGNY